MEESLAVIPKTWATGPKVEWCAMENEGEHIIAEHAKPKLTVDEQIARLKSKGVTFGLCSEDEARRILESESYWFRIAAYRALYDKHTEGKHGGKYINLDFAYLADLAAIDKQLRQTLLPMTLDVEHYAISKVERTISERDDEDGYSIVRDYWADLTDEERSYRSAEIGRLRGDFYCGELIRKYRDDMPAWVFMELLTFGAFINFFKFCARRWNDEEMRQNHYILRSVKSARNAYAHSSCIVSNFRRDDGLYRANIKVKHALEKAGMSKTARTKRMRNTALQQIATLIFAYSHFVTGDEDRRNAKNALTAMTQRIGEHKDYYKTNNAIASAFDFLEKAFDILWAMAIIESRHKNLRGFAGAEPTGFGPSCIPVLILSQWAMMQM